MTALPPSGNTARTRPENRAFFPALDGLRAIAFLMVFGQHYFWLAWGWTGVNVFFVLSGFLITGILFDSRDDPHRVRTFYLRRSLRIFPLFYGLFAVLLLLEPLMHWRWDRLWLLWPLYLGNMLAFLGPAATVAHTPLQLAADAHLSSLRLPRSELYLGHLWSLCVEEQFYLLWPWAVFWIRDRRKLIALCTSAVIAGPLFRLALQAYAPAWMIQQELLYRFTPAQFDALLLGGLLALLWRGAARPRLLQIARLAAAVGTVALACFMVFAVGSWRMYPAQYPSWHFTGGQLFADLYAGSVLVCALEPGRWIYNALRVRPLRWLGRLSYGAYVFHDLLHGLFVHLVVYSRFPVPFALQNTATATLALTSTLLFAWLSFRLFETPFLNLKDRWTLRTVVAGIPEREEKSAVAG